MYVVAIFKTCNSEKPKDEETKYVSEEEENEKKMMNKLSNQGNFFLAVTDILKKSSLHSEIFSFCVLNKPIYLQVKSTSQCHRVD